ncbi:MAG: DoxX family protein, partial [Chloroflexi bacterium]|nr:DoxX family protein [Chloroflexota bacterium]
MANVITLKGQQIQDPLFIQKLFGDTRTAWIWLVLRIWLGYKWIDASLHKIENPAWVKTGDALKGFWSSIVVIPEE